MSCETHAGGWAGLPREWVLLPVQERKPRRGAVFRLDLKTRSSLRFGEALVTEQREGQLLTTWDRSIQPPVPLITFLTSLIALCFNFRFLMQPSEKPSHHQEYSVCRWRREEEEKKIIAADAAEWLTRNIVVPDARAAMRSLMERVAELISNDKLLAKIIRSLHEDDDLFSKGQAVNIITIRPLGANNKRRSVPSEVAHKFLEALKEHSLLVADVESRYNVGPFQLVRLLYRAISQHSKPRDAIVDVFTKLRTRILSNHPPVTNPKALLLRRLGTDGNGRNTYFESSRSGISDASVMSDSSFFEVSHMHQESMEYRNLGANSFREKKIRNSSSGASVIDMLDTLKNDMFIRAAARSDIAKLHKHICEGQSLCGRLEILHFSKVIKVLTPFYTATHSQLRYTCLHAAVEFGQPLAVRLLIDAGCPLNCHIAPNGRTPLHYAAQHGRVDIAEMLLHAGAGKMVLDSDGRRPWHYLAGKLA